HVDRAEAADAARGDDLADRAAEAPEHPLSPEHRGQLRGSLDAVLERHDERFGSEERREGARRLAELPGLDAEDHRVDRPDLGRVVGRLGRVDDDLPLGRLDVQAAFPDRAQVLAAGDEPDLLALAGARELGAEIPARPAGPEDRDLHPRFSGSSGPYRTSNTPSTSTATS